MLMELTPLQSRWSMARQFITAFAITSVLYVVLIIWLFVWLLA
jgi:hypothetical protein